MIETTLHYYVICLILLPCLQKGICKKSLFPPIKKMYQRKVTLQDKTRQMSK